MAESTAVEVIPATSTNESKKQSVADTTAQDLSFDAIMRLPGSTSEKFAKLNKLVMRDLNGVNSSPTFSLYTKDQIVTFIQNPYQNQKALRDASIYLYNASSHYRRLIQYFVGLSDLAYVVSPQGIDTSTIKPETLRTRYNKTQRALTAMDIKNQFRKVLTVSLREDTFYGTFWVTNDNVTLQQLPSEYCDTAVIEGNVLNVSFNFSYFDTNSSMVDLYPPEFKRKYNAYLKDRTKLKWQELDSPTSFAIKCNTDILNYSIPPFAGMFREVYDLEDYKALRLEKTALENYALLVMKLGIDKDGNWEIPLDQAKAFYRNLDNVVPGEVGTVLTPMPIDKISFERSGVSDTETVSDAEQSLFTSAGVSSLLFNNEKASSNALLLSIKADQSITYGIVKSIEAVINRYIQAQSYGKNFKVTFLDCSPYNRKELGDQYLKACQYGLPMISYYCASQGMSMEEMDCMNFLEDEVLKVKERFDPLASSATQSTKTDAKEDAGRPEAEVGDLTDAGEVSQERDEE